MASIAWYTLVHFLLCGVYATLMIAILVGALGLSMFAGALDLDGIEPDHALKILEFAPAVFVAGGLGWGSGNWFRYVHPRLTLRDTRQSILASGFAAFVMALLATVILAGLQGRVGQFLQDVGVFRFFAFCAIAAFAMLWFGKVLDSLGAALTGHQDHWIDRLFMSLDEVDRYLRNKS